MIADSCILLFFLPLAHSMHVSCGPQFVLLLRALDTELFAISLGLCSLPPLPLILKCKRAHLTGSKALIIPHCVLFISVIVVHVVAEAWSCASTPRRLTISYVGGGIHFIMQTSIRGEICRFGVILKADLSGLGGVVRCCFKGVGFVG